MKTTEVTEKIIGKRCKSIFTGLMVTGVIEDLRITKNTAEVKVRYDEPHSWGNDEYETDWSYARFNDEFGSLKHLEIIDNQYEAVMVTFPKPVKEISKMFTNDYSNWQTVNLKEWIDNYDTSRFTQISETSAIITSEINMDNIREWIEKNIDDTVITDINK